MNGFSLLVVSRSILSCCAKGIMTVLFCLVFSATVDFCTVGSVLCRLYFVSSSSLRVRLLCEGSILWILCRSDCPWWRRYFRALRRVFLHPLQVHTMGNPCVVIKCAREQKKLLAGTLRCYLVCFFILFFCLFSSSFSSASCTTPHCTKGVLLQKMKCWS